MTLNRFVFKTHKWLAVGTLIFTLAWFVSGVVIVLPPNLLRQERPKPSEPPVVEKDFRAAKLSVAEAISRAEATAGKPLEVTGVLLRQLPGYLLYQITTRGGGTHLVDAQSGEKFEIGEAEARAFATAWLRGSSQVTEVRLKHAHSSWYGYGPLPAFEVQTNDRTGTRFYIVKQTGEMTTQNRMGYYRAVFHDIHSFAILRQWLAGRWIRLLLIVTSVVSTVMTLFGCWILWIQWKHWVAARQARAARAAS